MFATDDTDEERRRDPKVYQLLDIIAEEVSDVDRAANRRTYLVVKRRTEMDNDQLGAEVVEDETGALTVIDKAEAEDEDEEEKEQKAAPEDGA